MKGNLDCRLATSAGLAGNLEAEGRDAGLAALLREELARAVACMAAGALPIGVVAAPETFVTRGEGHFHVAPELFVQLSGWTQFRFPHTGRHLGAGEALLLPPQLLHAETVGAAGDGHFRNIVIYAAEESLTCHLAHETAPGVPGILHLEARRHPQAARVREWLSEAARLRGAEDAWSALQRRGLVVAAVAGVLRALDDESTAQAPEPALVARVRVLVQNQLGDHALSVRRLAQQSGCTADYLSHLFSQTAGEHLVAYINRQRVQRAAHLLRDTRLAGKEVAWACGYATPSYFIRSFREHFGVTPKAWRSALPRER